MNVVELLRELVAVQALRAEVLRLQQRRSFAIKREPAAVARVAALRAEVDKRAVPAWDAARSFLSQHEKGIAMTKDLNLFAPPFGFEVLLPAAVELPIGAMRSVKFVLHDGTEVIAEYCVVRHEYDPVTGISSASLRKTERRDG